MLQRASDKTHFIAAATQPDDGRIVLGSLWSKTSSNELYICIGVSPVTFQLLTGGTGAPVGSRYVVIGPADGTLTDERILTAGTNITLTDAGAGGAITIDAAGAASDLDGLSDVVITTPAATHHLRHNGTNWVNAVIPATDLPSAIDAAKLADGTVSNAEFQYLGNVTSDIQTQFTGKAASVHTHVKADVTDFAHASAHQSGGGDAIKLDDLAAADDVLDLNATTLVHGLLPKLGGGTTNFLRADGAWAEPPGTGGGGGTDNEILEWLGI